jgi:hypothetical protein
MSLNRCLFLVVALYALNAAAATDIHCPAALTSQGKSRPLLSASVFSGPPEELAELMPDVDTSEWDIAQDQMAAKRRSQSMFLVCRYEHSKATIQLRIPSYATLCKVEGTADGKTAAWCKAASRESLKSNPKGAHGHQS